MSDYDRWIEAGSPESRDVDVECIACGSEFGAVLEMEYGVGSLVPEECPACGSDELKVDQ
jgi:Zn finger protein HypA/HybF involved in hydrogenase expression